jgi:DNA-binding GntR family transcriptional regulator
MRSVAGPGKHSSEFARSLYSGRAVAYLREGIIEGVYPRGRALAEGRIATELSVSRGPIRSALTALEGEGLVHTLPNGRRVSAGFEERDIDEVFLVRGYLESTAVAWAIERGAETDDVRASFQSLVDEHDTSAHIAELDVGFHRALVEASGSRFLLQAWLGIAPIVQALIAIGNRRLAAADSAANYRRIVDAHREIVDAFALGDAAETSRLLTRQFDFTKLLVLARD